MSSSAINEKQPVYGDMMTLYVSQRISDGAILYKDIHGLYGPVNYLIGSSLLNLGLDYSGLKSFMIILSILSGFLVFLISNKLFSKPEIGVLSSATYLFLPIHYGMAPVFHPDSIAIFFVLVCIYFTLFERKFFFVTASLFGTLAIFTKIPVIPIVIVPILYFSLKKNKMIFFYLIPLLIITLLIISLTGSDKSSENTKMLIERIIQEPNSPLSEIRFILTIEGFAFLLAGIGLFIFVKNKKNNYFLLLFFASTLSYFSTLIPGVGPYLINYAEPFIAIFASFTIFYIAKKIKLKQSLVIITLIAIMFTQFAIFDFPDRESIADWDGIRNSLELNEITEGHIKLIEKFSNTGDLVVGSPMAVFKTHRIFPLDEPATDLLLIKNNLGFENSKNEINKLKEILQNKKISILISYNSTEKNLPIYNYLQKDLFYPYYLDEFKTILLENYDKFSENGFDYYLPK